MVARCDFDGARLSGGTLLRVAAVLAALLLFACGCASMRAIPAPEIEDLLGRSGFLSKPLSAPAVQAQSASLPVRKVVRVSRSDGSSRYVYKDPDGCKCVWVGTADAYSDYQAMLQEDKQAYAIDGEAESSPPFSANDDMEWEAQEGLW